MMSTKLNLRKIKKILSTHHGGPGPHKSGSSQDVHGAGSPGSGGEVGGSVWDKGTPEALKKFTEKRYPIAPGRVDGRTVIDRDDVANLSSVSASLYDYEFTPGVRTVRMDDFNTGGPTFYSKSERERVLGLADAIKASNQISPLIVVADPQGPYILEGGHRFDALKLLKAKSFPAVVVVDYDEELY